MDKTAKLPSLLIVDDDNFLLDMYALKFKQSGFDVTTSLGSEDALSKLAGGATPDIMLLDVVMPVMNGFELLKKLISDNIASTTIKIMLTNRGQQSDIDEGMKLGVAGYIVKANATPSEVIEKVKSIMSEKK